MMLVLVALLLSVASSVSAGERIPLTAEGFYSYEGYGLTAVKGDPFPAAYMIGEANGCPFGDSSCEARVDLGAYSKLYISMVGCDAEGSPNGSNPRIFINRTEYNGQFNSSKADSKCIVIPNAGTWAEEYYTKVDDETYVIDLLKIAKEFGFVHLHAIKGSAYNTQVIINSIEVEKASPAQQIGWVNLINNSDMEGEDASSFFTKVAKGDPQPSVITDGVGVDGSRGILVEATAKQSDPWDNQFWFRFNEVVPAETKYRVSFNYRADTDAKASTQAHQEPGNYIWYDMLGDVEFTTEWKTFTKEGTITAAQASNDQGQLFQSIAFNLNELADANNYYFDNIVFEVYKAGITAEYSSDVIKLDFGFNTNIADLVQASGLPRLLYPKDCATVKVDGELMEITTVEAFPDGRFYIFTEDMVDGNEVIVSLKNPSDPAYHLIYTNGPGGDVPNFETVAEENEEVALAEDAYSYAYVKPTVLSADPEDGSFNLPNDIKEFKLTFDKPADCSQIQATLGREKLIVSPAEGFASEITLTRSGAAALPTGEYTIKVTKIFCEDPLTPDDFTEYVYTINVGYVEADPNDVPKDIMSTEIFANTAAGGIPEGFFVLFGSEERTSESTYSSGPRMFDFGEGGDFTKGLYFREGYAQYGSVDGYELTLEANKKYRIHFNSAMWKDNGSTMNFQILDPNDDSVEFLAQTINNWPNVNGSQAAVDGSTSTDIDFIPATTGNYLLRWSVGGYNEVLIANVSVKYIPSTVGVEEKQMLADALENAKSTRDGNADERYAGAAYDALVAAIDKYEAEGPAYTAPSKYKAAATALNNAAQAMKDHRKNCDSYDEAIKKSIDVVRENADSKFNVTELYVQLKTLNEKYHASSEWSAYDPEDPDMGGEFIYTFDKLTDDAQLAEAVVELSNAAKVAGYMFTEGESKTSSDVGIKVLVDRIRQGVEGLKQLGVSENDDLIVRANRAVTDDDALAEELKNRIKLEYYGKMKAGENLFPETVDESTDETITPTYNFTVFAKNPNTYAWKASAGLTEENCPGWVAVEGNPGLTDAWNGSYPGDLDGLPKDLLFTAYHATNRIEQTITDLPAGIYTVMVDCAEWSDEFTPKDDDDEETIAQKEANHEQNRYYVKTSDTPEYVDGEEEQFAADGRIDFHGQYVARYENFLEDVVVTDGFLTIGVKWNNLAQMMFDRVQIFLAQPATGFDYAAAYNEALTGVEAAANTAKVLSVKMYDLNGQRLGVAKKGVVIIQKQMSDGSIKVEKVIK